MVPGPGLFFPKEHWPLSSPLGIVRAGGCLLGSTPGVTQLDKSTVWAVPDAPRERHGSTTHIIDGSSI